MRKHAVANQTPVQRSRLNQDEPSSTLWQLSSYASFRLPTNGRRLLQSLGRAELPLCERHQDRYHHLTMLEHAHKKSLDQIDWQSWKAVDPATLVFLRRSDEVLLIRKKRGLGAGKINGPGGRFEPGETAIECAIRETREEVGLVPHDLIYCGDNQFQFVDGYSIHVHVFISDRFSGKLQETAEAIPIWTPRSAIPYDEMWEDDRLWLPLALDGKSFSARYIFEGDRMLDHRLDLT